MQSKPPTARKRANTPEAGLSRSAALALVVCIGCSISAPAWGADTCLQQPVGAWSDAVTPGDGACVLAAAFGNAFASPFTVFATVVSIGFPVLWLIAWVSTRKQRHAGRKRLEQHWPTIRARYLEVIDESFERREAVISELAQALDLGSGAIQAELARLGIYKARGG